MADEALKRLEEQLNCSICLDTYTDPKLLQCFHVYCQQCLASLSSRNLHGSLTCPICRQVTPIPDRGVAGLQSAFHINHLLEIQDSVKKLQHLPDTLEGAVINTTTIGEKAVRCCFEHADEELKLYCETCKELVCYKCVIKGGKHQSHDYEELDQAFVKYTEKIMTFIKPLEEQVTIIKKALALIDQRRNEISEQRAIVEDDIHITFRRLREVLTLRETKLVGQLHERTQDKLKGLAAQSDQIETTLARLNSCLHFMRESIKVGDKSDVLMMKTNTVKRAEELTAFPADTLEPNTEADMKLSALEDMTIVCKNYGQIFVPGLPDPSKCHTTSMGVELAVVEVKSTTILHAVNFKGKQCTEAIKSLECELVSEITGTQTSCSVERRGQSQYEISYQPTIKGRHQFHIKVEGQYVGGSPSCVTVTSPVEKLGTPVLTIGKIGKPGGVAINERGQVVVTEVSGNCITTFSPSGKKLASFGTHGSGQGQLDNPFGLTVDDDGEILVADSLNNRVHKFAANGQFLKAVGAKGSKQLQFDFPTDIAFNTSNKKLYVADSGNSRIQVLNSDLTFSSTFGIGRRGSPRGIACDSTGKVYVADTANHHIQVLSAEGEFLSKIGQEMKEPCSIAVDTSGMVYVSEGGNHCVSVFTTQGRFVTSFGKKGTGQGEFNRPCGLAVDKSGVVYVCDRINSRVQVL